MVLKKSARSPPKHHERSPKQRVSATPAYAPPEGLEQALRDGAPLLASGGGEFDAAPPAAGERPRERLLRQRRALQQRPHSPHAASCSGGSTLHAPRRHLHRRLER